MSEMIDSMHGYETHVPVFRQAGEAPEGERFAAEYPEPAAPGDEVFPARLVEALRPAFVDAP
ncbi:hypothetical protein ACFQ8S_31165 [Streptomyces virginiae]|uniref:hypothetical protein n=1 Tax=Streptomyces virginiae TaxID=1961 RepID=UPI0036C8ACCA